jgi:hypothetical protein
MRATFQTIFLLLINSIRLLHPSFKSPTFLFSLYHLHSLASVIPPSILLFILFWRLVLLHLLRLDDSITLSIYCFSLPHFIFAFSTELYEPNRPFLSLPTRVGERNKTCQQTDIHIPEGNLTCFEMGFGFDSALQLFSLLFTHNMFHSPVEQLHGDLDYLWLFLDL